jgi:hypothetical protein
VRCFTFEGDKVVQISHVADPDRLEQLDVTALSEAQFTRWPAMS